MHRILFHYFYDFINKTKNKKKPNSLHSKTSTIVIFYVFKKLENLLHQQTKPKNPSPFSKFATTKKTYPKPKTFQNSYDSPSPEFLLLPERKVPDPD